MTWPQREPRPIRRLGQEWVKLVRSCRWALIIAVVAACTGYMSGLADGQSDPLRAAALWSERTAQFPESLLSRAAGATQTFTMQHPTLDIFFHNASLLLVTVLSGILSLGIVAFASACTGAYELGQMVGMMGAMSGTDGARSTAAILLPHGLLELPVILLGCAVGMRAGTAWLFPLRQTGRLASVKGLVRSFAPALPVLLLLLGVAALLEVNVNPAFIDGQLLRLHRSGGALTERRVGAHFIAHYAALSPDGRRMAVVTASGERVIVTDVEAWQPEVVADDDGQHVFLDVSWSPDGSQLLVTRGSTDDLLLAPYGDNTCTGVPCVLDLARSELREVPAMPPGTCLSAVWGPDSDRIAAVVRAPVQTNDSLPTTNVWTAHAEKGEWRRITDFPPGLGVALGSGLAWSPDGREIAIVRKEVSNRRANTGAQRKIQYKLCAVSADGASSREISLVGSPTKLGWSPDGRWIAYVNHASFEFSELSSAPICSGNLTLVRQDSSQSFRGPTRVDTLSSVSWTHDGRQLLYTRFGTPLLGTLRPPA